jgi:NAD(P)-dependent dehydrogenase (short-subunit alcohol dehydrogenase family)
MRAFEGKVVLVTGASSGLGEAAALKLAREGAKVVVAARREDESRAVVAKIEELGGEGFFIKTDVTLRRDIQAMVEGTLERFGNLDCAVNNAGTVGPNLTPVADIEEEGWDELMNTNLKSVWLCMKYEIPAMLAQGKGSIVNVSSIYGFKPSDLGHAPYCASKFALIGLSKTAAVDYALQGIRVNVVAPGFAHSEGVDPYVESAPDLMKAVVARHSGMNRIGGAEEIAEATAWLCSDASSFVNGVVLPVDGGDTTRLY